jgi:hypothetical protein
VSSHAALRPGPFELYRYQGRHRRQADGGGTARSIAITAGVVAAVMSGDVSPAQAAPGMSGEDTWHPRMCEAGDHQSADIGSGYHGESQLDLRTLRPGGTGDPNRATPPAQRRLARSPYQRLGWSSWTYARILGLTEGPSYGIRTQPLTVRSSTSFAPGQRVTVTGSAQPGAPVTVYGMYRGQPTPSLLATVRTGPQGSWTACVHPTSTVTLYAVSGTVRSATVQATMLHRITLDVSAASPHQVSGQAHLGRYVTGYAKPYNWSAWRSAQQVRVAGAGDWSMVWRASADFTFTVRGDVARPVRTVPARPKMTPKMTPELATDEMATDSAPGAATGVGTGGAGLEVSGIAKPDTSVTVYLRRPGRTPWRTLAPVTSDAYGHWAATLPGNGYYEYYAKSANGQASAVLTVP